jgi:hypothetical protein
MRVLEARGYPFVLQYVRSWHLDLSQNVLRVEPTIVLHPHDACKFMGFVCFQFFSPDGYFF